MSSTNHPTSTAHLPVTDLKRMLFASHIDQLSDLLDVLDSLLSPSLDSAQPLSSSDQTAFQSFTTSKLPELTTQLNKASSLYSGFDSAEQKALTAETLRRLEVFFKMVEEMGKIDGASNEAVASAQAVGQANPFEGIVRIAEAAGFTGGEAEGAEAEEEEEEEEKS
ncbi:unnamed protein product [Zymoseptoria tritici ST99CH_3D7]|uniref:Uncharacterized protein n=1 Tax=Zymoseptoria tritici (strain ST99CH_3D7) TaxID=1276538 RepID=A0A1X7RK31_ZYMT9|nr:unnamed protein product [Zymoseptoria tritici ST99CH_3D7]